MLNTINFLKFMIKTNQPFLYTPDAFFIFVIFVIKHFLLEFDICFLHVFKATRLHNLLGSFICTFYTKKISQLFHISNRVSGKVFI